MYKKCINEILKCSLPIQALKNKSILISGGTGLIGKVLTDMFCILDNNFSLNLRIILVSRNKSKFSSIFQKSEKLSFIEHDISKPLDIDFSVDFVIHLAANTHPLVYSKYPVETITTNFMGTYNLLELCRKNPGSRFLNLSSVEIYGENNTEKLRLTEKDSGYIDCNTVRAGYNESKRACETLCQAYNSQYNVDFSTARLCRVYGPTLQKDDSKALSQFLFKGLNGENIILKSKGEQFFSYIDVFSACTALLTILLTGKTGEAYNISDENCDIKLKDLAELVADCCGTKVIFDLPSEAELKGFSKASIAVLDSTKLKSLGWKPVFDIKNGISTTLNILKNQENING